MPLLHKSKATVKHKQLETRKSSKHEELMNYITVFNSVSSLVSCVHTMCTLTGCFIMRNINNEL